MTPENAPAEAAARPMRADARRNYDTILVFAREVFAEQGTGGSLDEIARRAGVGPGTLYRHFPTRADLLDALMREWGDRVLGDAEAAVAAGEPARETLLRWFEKLVEHTTLHRGAAARLTAAMDDPSSPIYRKCQVLAAANGAVLDHLAERGELRAGVETRDVTRLIGGVASAADAARLGPADIRPMLAVVVDGLVRQPTV
jgi:AcrR family transcriptional regulator